MGDSTRGDALFVERSWPPPRYFGYVLIPVVILALPTPFIEGDYRPVAAFACGLLFLFFGSAVTMTALRNWWVTSTELCIDRAPILAMIFYGFRGRCRVPLSNIDSVDTVAGTGRALEREAFGRRATVREGMGGSCGRYWCKEAVVVRLREPDEYGDTALLSTHRPQEAHRVLTEAIDADRARREPDL